MISPNRALERLKEGNRRFVADVQNRTASQTRRMALTSGQEPFAAILGCSDSRVPAEIVFDQGLGDLFVIRVAGNVVAPSGIGSIEFAATRFGTQLVVVLGHSSCGAILATMEELQQATENRSPNLHSIVNRIRPSVEPLLLSGEHEGDSEALIDHAVRSNIDASVNQLRRGSAILEQLIAEGRLAIVGALYSLDTGVVEFFPGNQR
jgi:carbonic anhydrase